MVSKENKRKMKKTPRSHLDRPPKKQTYPRLRIAPGPARPDADGKNSGKRYGFEDKTKKETSTAPKLIADTPPATCPLRFIAPERPGTQTARKPIKNAMV